MPEGGEWLQLSPCREGIQRPRAGGAGCRQSRELGTRTWAHRQVAERWGQWEPSAVLSENFNLLKKTECKVINGEWGGEPEFKKS